MCRPEEGLHGADAGWRPQADPGARPASQSLGLHAVQLKDVLTREGHFIPVEKESRDWGREQKFPTMTAPASGSHETRRWRKPDSNSQSHLNEKPFRAR
jgi:hypothetical protein